jgi:phenylpropionate dioxygenase-like ring-hydroxylating dioxygenase large terminal subunit
VTAPRDTGRLAFLLETARREAGHLRWTAGRLFREPIDAAWVDGLDGSPELAKRVDAFVARFARLQDCIGDKLVPELLCQLLEPPGSALDNLNRMERLGPLASVGGWVEARNLRNRLVQEYMRETGPAAGADRRKREKGIEDRAQALPRTLRRSQGWPPSCRAARPAR